MASLAQRDALPRMSSHGWPRRCSSVSHRCVQESPHVDRSRDRFESLSLGELSAFRLPTVSFRADDLHGSSEYLPGTLARHSITGGRADTSDSCMRRGCTDHEPSCRASESDCCQAACLCPRIVPGQQHRSTSRASRGHPRGPAGRAAFRPADGPLVPPSHTPYHHPWSQDAWALEGFSERSGLGFVLCHQVGGRIGDIGPDARGAPKECRV